MQKIKTKAITRSAWPRVPHKTFVCDSLDLPFFRGAAALIRMDKVNTPLIVHSCGDEIVLADVGYYWVQVAPEHAHWWLTYMINPNGEIYQYYFDITLENRIDGSASEFDDLFLDVVALPDGRCELLDRDELEEALRENVITDAQYKAACSEASVLMTTLPRRIDELNRFCAQLYTRLHRLMEQQCQ